VKDGDANQRIVMSDDGRGCGSQSGSDGANRAHLWSLGAAKAALSVSLGG
jgi:hypothetical protein